MSVEEDVMKIQKKLTKMTSDDGTVSSISIKIIAASVSRTKYSRLLFNKMQAAVCYQPVFVFIDK